jgi:hypothetical protein
MLIICEEIAAVALMGSSWCWVSYRYMSDELPELGRASNDGRALRLAELLSQPTSLNALEDILHDVEFGHNIDIGKL